MPGAKNINETIFLEPISAHIWDTRLRLAQARTVPEPTIRETWERVALALSKPESHHRDVWYERFEILLRNFRFLPDPSILRAAGVQHRVTLFNCFTMGMIDDSIDAIFNILREAMLTMQEGSNIGCDFSTVRPAGWPATGSGNRASGPVSFMPAWNQACAALMSTSERHGTMTAVLRCDHPDIEQFIDAKRAQGSLPHFNLSVLISDDFMRAVEEDAPWPLVFPLLGRPVPDSAAVTERAWYSAVSTVPCLVVRTISARALWNHLLQAAYDGSEPGVIFIDRVQQANNLWYVEQVSATTPCGEIPLPPHGTCATGSINLAQFVDDPFGRHPKLDMPSIALAASVATRMLDNVYDISHFPIKSQKTAALASRRLGLGITGLADAFAMLGVRYGSDAAIETADAVMQTICHAAYRASIELAGERGSFPAYRASEYTASDFVLSLPRTIIDAIAQSGIRNSHLVSIAPAVSISLLANNVSSGIQPVRAFQDEQIIRRADGTVTAIPTHDYAWALFRQLHGKAKLPNSFVEAKDVDPLDQIKLQAVLQGHVDTVISKTVTVPKAISFDRFKNIYQHAYSAGLKGCAVLRFEGGSTSAK